MGKYDSIVGKSKGKYGDIVDDAEQSSSVVTRKMPVPMKSIVGVERVPKGEEGQKGYAQVIEMPEQEVVATPLPSTPEARRVKEYVQTQRFYANQRTIPSIGGRQSPEYRAGEKMETIAEGIRRNPFVNPLAPTFSAIEGGVKGAEKIGEGAKDFVKPIARLKNISTTRLPSTEQFKELQRIPADVRKGIMKGVLGSAEMALSAGLTMAPVANYSFGVAGEVSPKIMPFASPVSYLTKPTTEEGQVAAMIGDVIYQAGALKAIHGNIPKIAERIQSRLQSKKLTPEEELFMTRQEAGDVRVKNLQYKNEGDRIEREINSDVEAQQRARGEMEKELGRKLSDAEFEARREQIRDYQPPEQLLTPQGQSEVVPSLLFDENGRPIPAEPVRSARAPLTEPEVKTTPFEGNPAEGVPIRARIRPQERTTESGLVLPPERLAEMTKELPPLETETLPDAYRAEMKAKLGDEAKNLSDPELVKLIQERGLDKGDIAEAPVSQGGNINIRGEGNQAMIDKKIAEGKITPEQGEFKPKGSELLDVTKTKWVRGINKTNEGRPDKFYSASKGTAANYSTTNLGDKPRYEKIQDYPKNPLVVNDKTELAEQIGYKGDPLAEPFSTKEKFDDLAKKYAQEKGHDAIAYQEGTFGEPELHVFGKEASQPPKVTVKAKVEPSVQDVPPAKNYAEISSEVRKEMLGKYTPEQLAEMSDAQKSKLDSEFNSTIQQRLAEEKTVADKTRQKNFESIKDSSPEQLKTLFDKYTEEQYKSGGAGNFDDYVVGRMVSDGLIKYKDVKTGKAFGKTVGSELSGNSYPIKITYEFGNIKGEIETSKPSPRTYGESFANERVLRAIYSDIKSKFDQPTPEPPKVTVKAKVLKGIADKKPKGGDVLRSLAIAGTYGVETDDDGNPKINPVKFLLGLAGGLAGSIVLNPNIRAKLAKVIGRGAEKMSDTELMKEYGKKTEATITDKASEPSRKAIAEELIPVAQEAIKNNEVKDGLKYAYNINTERLNISAEDISNLRATIETIRPQLEKETGKPLTDIEVIEAAQGHDLLKHVITREQTKKVASAILNTRKAVAGQSQTGGITKEFVDNIRFLSSFASDAGRRLQKFNIKADPTFKNIKEDVVKKLIDAGVDADKLIKASEGVNFNNAKEVATFYRQFIKPNLNELLNEFRYINLLSSPLTHIINTFSNVLQGGGLVPLTKLHEGGIDYIGATLDKRQRQVYMRSVPEYFKGMANSLPEAGKNFLSTVKGERFTLRPDLEGIPSMGESASAIGKPIAKFNQAFRFVTDLLEAEDIFLQTLIKGGEKEALAYTAKRRGEVVDSKAINQLAEKRAREYLFRAELDPSNSTGQGALLSAIDKKVATQAYKFRSVPVVGWVVPFVRTPANILKEGISYSPAGFATLLKSTNQQHQLAKAIVGSAVFAGAASVVATHETTWEVPKNAKEKEEFYRSGKQPYSIKVGDNWYSVTKLGALAYPIAMPMAIKYYATQSKDAQDANTFQKIENVLAGQAKFFFDQSYVQGIGDLIDAIGSGRADEWERLVSNLSSQLIPLSSLQNWTRNLVDPVYRKPSGVGQSLMVKSPLTSKYVPATDEGKKEDVFGLPGEVVRSFSPIRISGDKSRIPAYKPKGAGDSPAEVIRKRIKSRMKK